VDAFSSTGTPAVVWLGTSDSEREAMPMLTFDRMRAAPQAGGWRSWPLYFFVPASSCYYLEIHYGGKETPENVFCRRQVTGIVPGGVKARFHLRRIDKEYSLSEEDIHEISHI
jgi:hypothetical protein